MVVVKSPTMDAYHMYPPMFYRYLVLTTIICPPALVLVPSAPSITSECKFLLLTGAKKKVLYPFRVS